MLFKEKIMWIILLAAILLAFGIFILYKLFEEGKSDKATALLIILSLIFLITGGWLIFKNITIETIMRKLGGIVCVILGIFLVFKFPGHADYGIQEFIHASIIIGLILLIFGVWLTLF